MKVVFVGPSLPQAAEIAAPGIEIRPPAVQGDLVRAVRSGASALGLIDGNFEYVAPVWHKEILFALSQGVAVFGAASMGALRAAECAAFGMVGVGQIYEGYAKGLLIDDSDVAMLHGPEELKWIALSVPMVNVSATLRNLRDLAIIGDAEFHALDAAAAAFFYKDRTWAAVVREAALGDSVDRRALVTALRSHLVDLKAADARQLLHAIAKDATASRPSPPDWQFQATAMWNTAFA